MPLFLFTNGLVVKKLVFVKSWNFLWRKFRQIMIPFFIWGGLITLFREKSYFDFIWDYWKFGYWYLLVLFEFFIIIGLINIINSALKRFCSDKFVNAMIITMIILVYLPLRFLGPYIPSSIGNLIDYYQMLDYYPYFAFGLIIKQLNLIKYLDKYRGVTLTTTLILTVSGLCIFLSSKMSEPAIIFFRIIMILFTTVLFMSFEKSERHGIISGKGLSMLSCIGRHTMSIYMLQFFIFRYIDLTDVYNYLMASNNTIALLSLTSICAILICYICIAIETIIDKSVYLRFILGK